jgi:hypothetical protein
MVAAVTLVALCPMTAVAEWACAETNGGPETSHCFTSVGGHIVGVNILLLRATGALDETRFLPNAPALASDDPAVRKEREQEMDDAVEASREDALVNRGADPQRKDHGAVHATGVVTPSRWFSNIAVKDRDLLIVPATTDSPPGALLVISEDQTTPLCYQLPEAFVSTPISQQLAATNDAIWLRKPFGFVRWSDLVALASSEEKDNGRTPLK